MLRKFLTAVFVAFSILFMGNNAAFAETQKVMATGEYDYGDRETREDAKRAALEDAKRNALEKVIVQVKAYSVMKEFNIIEDAVRSYTAGRLRIIDRKFEFAGEKMTTCIATIVAVVDFDLEEIADYAARNDSATKPNVPNNVAPAPVSNNEILNGALEWNGHYYKIFSMPMSWENAGKFCESVGGHLAVPETRAENEFIKRIFMQYGSENICWIGGYLDDTGFWRWVTGKIIASYFDWAEMEPDDRYSKIALDRSTYGQWTASEYLYFFMCEWESADDAHDSTL